jgi:DivIVA domain-containing protein
MDDDPEKRIAELERQLAAQSPAGSATNAVLTPEQVRNIRFSKPPLGRRGYNEDEVKALLELVEAALRDPAAGLLTAEQVHDIAFSKPRIGRRGYHTDEVDAFLDAVERQLNQM